MSISSPPVSCIQTGVDNNVTHTTQRTYTTSPQRPGLNAGGIAASTASKGSVLFSILSLRTSYSELAYVFHYYLMCFIS